MPPAELSGTCLCILNQYFKKKRCWKMIHDIFFRLGSTALFIFQLQRWGKFIEHNMRGYFSSDMCFWNRELITCTLSKLGKCWYYFSYSPYVTLRNENIKDAETNLTDKDDKRDIFSSLCAMLFIILYHTHYCVGNHVDLLSTDIVLERYSVILYW